MAALHRAAQKRIELGKQLRIGEGVRRTMPEQLFADLVAHTGSKLRRDGFDRD